jgi:hypothetical protein
LEPAGRVPQLKAADDAKVINAGGEDPLWRYVRLSAICLRQIDVLSRAKDCALPGRYIGRYSPQPQRDIERIDTEPRPEGKLANSMLFLMTGGA